jgi:hypothetical protein
VHDVVWREEELGSLEVFLGERSAKAGPRSSSSARPGIGKTILLESAVAGRARTSRA